VIGGVAVAAGITTGVVLATRPQPLDLFSDIPMPNVRQIYP
jgi:hypothetical protein